MKTQFRETSPQDMPAVAAFLQRIFDVSPGLPLTEARHLHWKCWEERPDWAGSRGFMLTREDQIVAHGTLVPLSYVSGGKRLRLMHLIDWAADPKAVGSGVTLLKNIGKMVDAVVVAGGSDMTQKVLPALGFKTCGQVTHFARPLHPLRRLAGQNPSVRLGAQFARNLLWWMQAPTVGTEMWTARRIGPDQLASQPVRWPREVEGTGIFERSAGTIRYFLKCPVTPMEFYAVSRNGMERGYFLLAHAPGQVRIADFHVEGGASDWRALLALAVSEAARNRDAAEVVAVGSDAVTRQALADCGFHARGGTALRVLTGKGVEFPAGPMRFHMLDSDAAYLHENRKAYWA